MTKGRTIMIFLLFINQLSAKTFPNTGEVFPIHEESLLDVIVTKLHTWEQTGELNKLQKQLQDRVKKSIERPPPVTFLKKTTIPRTYTFDPSFTTNAPILLDNTTVLAKKGVRINPLSSHKFSKSWLFIDGDDEKHVAWAIHYPKPKKIILVNGNPLKLSDIHEIPIYFDQEARLSKRFKLQQVPAVISQDGEVLKIEEIVLEKASKK